jgi:hypothetical protein
MVFMLSDEAILLRTKFLDQYTGSTAKHDVNRVTIRICSAVFHARSHLIGLASTRALSQRRIPGRLHCKLVLVCSPYQTLLPGSAWINS